MPSGRRTDSSRRRLAAVFRAMEDLGLKQTIVTDETALFYLLGQRVEPMERCAALLLTEGGRGLNSMKSDRHLEIWALAVPGQCKSGHCTLQERAS